MGSFTNLLLLTLFLFSFSSNLIPRAKSDEKLINTLCSKTEEPVVCKDCLLSDPKSSSADGQGLAIIALKCAEKDATHLQEDTFNLAQKATGKLKGILDDCASHAFMAQQDFEPVEGYVQQGYYKSARDVITGEIIPYVAYCLKLFNEAPDLPVPQLVLAGSVAVNQTSKNAAAILSNI